MKTKRIVAGAAAAALLSFAACSLPMAFAASDTVQISAGTDEAMPGEEFSVDIMLDVPSSGLQVCDFSVYYDSSLLNVTSVTAGALTETGADANDPYSSDVPSFTSYIHSDEGSIDIMWSTLSDSQYWISGSGVMCTISGTVAADAKSGTIADVTIGATKRQINPGSATVNDAINAGYINGSESVKYDTAVSDGAVVIGADVQTTTVSGEVSTLRGDADLDGKVNITDAVAIVSWLANSAKYPIEPQGLINADVIGDGDGVNINDAVQIQTEILG